MLQDACTLATKESIQKTLRTEDLQCRYYEAIVNTTTDLIAITDGQRILDANKSLMELCEGIGLNVFDKSFSFSGLFAPIQKFGYIYDGYQDLPWYAHVEKKKNSDCRVGIMVDGALYTYNLTLRPLEVFTGIYVMTLSDVTEMMGYKTTLEEGIKSSAKDRDKTQFMLQQYDKAMEAATMVFKCDLEGIITYSNRALCEALAYASGELIGKHLLTLRGKSVTDQTYATISSIRLLMSCAPHSMPLSTLPTVPWRVLMRCFWTKRAKSWLKCIFSVPTVTRSIFWSLLIHY
jgi:PAS domain-containing protein